MAGNSKNFLPPHKIADAVSMAASFVSNATNIQYLDNINLQIIFTGTPTGTFTVEVSTNHKKLNGSVVTEGNWDTLTTSTLSAAGADGSITVDLSQLGSSYLRVRYTRTSGTGSCDVFISGKAI